MGPALSEGELEHEGRGKAMGGEKMFAMGVVPTLTVEVSKKSLVLDS